MDENDWTQQYKWFTAKLEQFNEVFSERIKVLNAEYWVPDDANNDE